MFLHYSKKFGYLFKNPIHPSRLSQLDLVLDHELNLVLTELDLMLTLNLVLDLELDLVLTITKLDLIIDLELYLVLTIAELI